MCGIKKCVKNNIVTSQISLFGCKVKVNKFIHSFKTYVLFAQFTNLIFLHVSFLS